MQWHAVNDSATLILQQFINILILTGIRNIQKLLKYIMTHSSSKDQLHTMQYGMKD
jgi:hypothetical protein